MEPPFAKAVDPVFLGAIELLERVQHTATQPPQQERSKLQGLISRAEAALGNNEEWELAKYAIVSWIDSALIDAPWDGSTWWEDNPLEREYFIERKAFTEFYAKANKAAALPKKNALEVFYICVVLGFRGMYSDASSMQFASELDLPTTLEDWASKTAMTLHLGVGRPPITEQPRPVDGAPPLEGRSSLMMASIFALIALALPLGMLLFEWNNH